MKILLFLKKMLNVKQNNMTDLETKRQRQEQRKREKLKREQDQQLWKDVKSYKRLVQLNVQFLQGKISSPYHGDKLDEETLPLVKDFVQVNKLGLLTYDSQPGGSFTRYDRRLKTFVNWEQKFYVNGLFPKRSLKKLVDFIATRPDLMMIAVDGARNVLFDNFPRDKQSYDLVRHRYFTKSKGKIVNMQSWERGDTRLPLALFRAKELDPAYQFMDLPVYQLLLKQTIDVTIAATNFATESPLRDLLTF